MSESVPILDRLQDSFDPISKIELDALEADLRVDFPDDYRSFLLKYNGGTFQHWVKFRVRYPTQLAREGNFEHSLGIVDDPRRSLFDIRSTVDDFRCWIPSELLPIGLSVVRLLLEHDAKTDARDADGCTPLYHAAMGQSHDSLKLLLASGANPRCCDDRGRILASRAEELDYHRIARTLQKHLTLGR